MCANVFIHKDWCGLLGTDLDSLQGTERKPQRTDISVFYCFSTKAMHKEIVSDLTTGAFIGASICFVGRRAIVKTFTVTMPQTSWEHETSQWSLRKLYIDNIQESISMTCSDKRITFHNMPPRATHVEGL